MSHLPLLCWGYSLLNIRHSRRSKSYTASQALQPLSLRREPTQKPCFPRQKTIFVWQTWFIFYGRALPCFPSGLSFPPFSRSYPRSSILLLLWPVVCSRVGGSQPLISYHLFVRNQEIFDYFIDIAKAYIPTPNWVQLQRGTYANWVKAAVLPVKYSIPATFETFGLYPLRGIPKRAQRAEPRRGKLSSHPVPPRRASGSFRPCARAARNTDNADSLNLPLRCSRDFSNRFCNPNIITPVHLPGLCTMI